MFEAWVCGGVVLPLQAHRLIQTISVRDFWFLLWQKKINQLCLVSLNIRLDIAWTSNSQVASIFAQNVEKRSIPKKKQTLTYTTHTKNTCAQSIQNTTAKTRHKKASTQLRDAPESFLCEFTFSLGHRGIICKGKFSNHCVISLYIVCRLRQKW